MFISVSPKTVGLWRQAMNLRKIPSETNLFGINCQCIRQRGYKK